MTISEYFSGLFGGIKSLLIGMSVTIKEFFSKKITQQYPENRATLVIPSRFRGNLIMPHDENNEHACTACGICQMNCPNGTITVKSEMVQTEDGKKKRVLTQYVYDLGTCTFCNLCVLTCPSNAIEFDGDFENSMFTRGKLIKKLNNEGSKLKEKKVAPKPATAPAPAPAKPVEKEADAVVEENIVEPKEEVKSVEKTAEGDVANTSTETKKDPSSEKSNE